MFGERFMKHKFFALLTAAALTASMVCGTSATLLISPKPAASPFVDVSADDWYYSPVMMAVEKGLFSGVSGDRFAPDAGMDRAMMVTVLAAMEFGVRGAPKSDSTFTDLTADWYKNAVAWAAEHRITYGISNTEFAPHMALTREQVAVFLFAYSQHKGYDVSVGENTNILSYNDALEISAWAYPAMQWACGAGLIGGTPDGYLLPNVVASRAQVAAILTRFDALYNS